MKWFLMIMTIPIYLRYCKVWRTCKVSCESISQYHSSLYSNFEVKLTFGILLISNQLIEQSWTEVGRVWLHLLYWCVAWIEHPCFEWWWVDVPVSIVLVLAQGNVHRSSTHRYRPSADGNLFVGTKSPKIKKKYAWFIKIESHRPVFLKSNIQLFFIQG